MNEWQRLGNISERSLLEIWHGRPLARLRDHLAVGDFSLGCERCGFAQHLGSDAPYSRVFDHLEADGQSPAWPTQLELALSNTCNLQCVMCNGDLSSAIRSQREARPPLPTVYDDRFFEELSLFLPHLTHLVLLGGEPLLARESRRVLSMLVERGLTPHCHITTNGTIWNEATRRLVQALPVHLAISIDALSPDLAESIRVGVNHRHVLDTIDRIRREATHEGSSTSISFSLMRSNWHELALVCRWAEERSMQVFVNEVIAPVHLSLLHAPVAELDTAVRQMTASTSHIADLELNRPVWEEQLGRITRLRDQRSVAHPDAVAEVSLTTRARVTIHTDSDQIIRQSTGHLLDHTVDAQELLGSRLQDLVGLLGKTFGELVASELDIDAAGVERRVIRFSQQGILTTITALLITSSPETQQWQLTASADDDRPLPGAVPIRSPSP